MKIILASISPRRKELLSMAKIPFEVRSKNIEEVHPENTAASAISLYLAKLKAKAFEAEITSEIVIGADTIVILNGEIFEKPKSHEEAVEMLQKLSGKTHEVITGVFIFSKEKEVGFSVSTLVTFNKLSSQEIEYYVTNFKPFDKAGSYACQEWIGAVGIKEFKGDYFNVVGLPVNKVYQVLVSEFGFKLSNR
ncbi:MAG TPA: Maf family nucleotide pyrophosphatase [Chitinophagales bacterium]|nr:Maf family nucleotide pyrophosphatase [Chitinophagales bacterium]HRP38973.1 Maf family nucleotide pyrophosphatase [Chitinophagales bacterium]